MERRLSSLIAPTWLLPNKTNHINVFAITPEEENKLPHNSPIELDSHRGGAGKTKRMCEFLLASILIWCHFRLESLNLNSAIPRSRPESNFADTEVEELISMLRETENLEEQGDILQYLVDTQGLDFNTGKIRCDKDTVIFFFCFLSLIICSLICLLLLIALVPFDLFGGK